MRCRQSDISAAGEGIGFLVGEGLHERDLAHAADAVEASRGWLRRIEQRGAQAGQFRFAPDEVCVRPSKLPRWAQSSGG